MLALFQSTNANANATPATAAENDSIPLVAAPAQTSIAVPKNDSTIVVEMPAEPETSPKKLEEVPTLEAKRKQKLLRKTKTPY